MKRTLAMILSVLMVLTLLAGCGSAPETNSPNQSTTANTDTQSGDTQSAPADAERELNVAWKKDITTYDVHMTTDDYSVPINVFDRLFEIVNENGSAQLVNSLVEDYSVSEDGMSFSFVLKDGVKFSDGSALTADDVAYTFTRMVALEGSQQEYLFETVEGYEEFTGSGNYHDAVLPGITVEDTTHFSIRLATPYAGFLNILGSPACCIYSKAVVESAGESFGLDPAYAIGTSAYVLDSWTRDVGAELSYNANYWGAKPDFTTVHVMIVPDVDTMSLMFQNNELDILDCGFLDSAVVASVYKTMYADKLVAATRLGTSYMALNASSGALADPVARKAVQMCIDRQLIIDTLYNGDGQTLDGIFPAGLVGYAESNQGWLSYDPEGAAKMLEDAGYTKDANGFYFSFVINNDEGNSASRQNTVLAISDMLQKNGINAVVSTSDHSGWLASRKAGELDSYVSTWTADYNDPDNFIATFWGNAKRSLGRSLCYSDEAVMERVTAAPGITNDAERMAEYAALEKQLIEVEASWVPLFQETHLFCLGQNVSAFVPHWAGYADFQFAGVKAA